MKYLREEKENIEAQFFSYLKSNYEMFFLLSHHEWIISTVFSIYITSKFSLFLFPLGLCHTAQFFFPFTLSTPLKTSTFTPSQSPIYIVFFSFTFVSIERFDSLMQTIHLLLQISTDSSFHVHMLDLGYSGVGAENRM